MNRLLLGLFYVFVRSAISRNFTINVFNVGQADSQLIMFPSGYTILVDLGELSFNSHRNADAVSQRIYEITNARHIDTIVVTHLHTDHVGEFPYGGIGYFMESKNFTVGQLIDRNSGRIVDIEKDCDKNNNIEYIYAGTTSSTSGSYICYSNSRKYSAYKKRVIAKLCSTDQIAPPDEGALVTIVSVDANGAKMKNGDPIAANHVNDKSPPSENDFSVGILVRYKDFVYATLGDLDGQYVSSSGYVYDDVETVAAPNIGEVDVYNVNHHGSAHSSNPTFVNTLKPTVSMISCGEENQYNHPDQEILDRLSLYGDIYLTNNGTHTRDYHGGIVGGEIEISTDGVNGYRVTTTSNTIMSKNYKIKQAITPQCVP